MPATWRASASSPSTCAVTGRSTWEAPWTVETHLADLLETADSLGIGSATWIGHSYGGRLVAELATRHPERVERAVLLDPAMHVDPAVATERAEGLRADLSFDSPDEAIDARLTDGTLFTTPRSVLQEEADAHLVHSPDGRWRWRYSPASVIAAWSVMASPAPAWPDCPTLVVDRPPVMDPQSRFRACRTSRASPSRAGTPSSGTTPSSSSRPSSAFLT